jgi:hypothetical protein
MEKRPIKSVSAYTRPRLEFRAAIKVSRVAVLYIATRDITVANVSAYETLESQQVVHLPNRGACSS